MNDPIKTCRCGGIPLLRNFGTDEKPIWGIQCVDCMKSVLGTRDEIKELIIERWNAEN